MRCRLLTVEMSVADGGVLRGQKGEELRITYIRVAETTAKERRRKLLEFHGFTCYCTACSEESGATSNHRKRQGASKKRDKEDQAADRPKRKKHGMEMAGHV